MSALQITNEYIQQATSPRLVNQYRMLEASLKELKIHSAIAPTGPLQRRVTSTEKVMQTVYNELENRVCNLSIDVYMYLIESGAGFQILGEL